jgi:enoyl-CoA hydratase/carnithine racemase
LLRLEFTSKMNAIDGEILKLIGQAVPLVASKFKALVVYNEGSAFSAGANLGLALFAINIAAWGEIEKMVSGGQMALKALKYAPFPVVAAPAGLALGGGCEIVLHADAVQAHAESYIGLVECGVGLVPGWGGCGEMLARWQAAKGLPKGPVPAVSKVFETISTATVSKSAAEAMDLGFLRPTDGITMNRDRLLADAKARALALAEGYQPPAAPTYRLPGAGGKAALELAVAGFRARGHGDAARCGRRGTSRRCPDRGSRPGRYRGRRGSPRARAQGVSRAGPPSRHKTGSSTCSRPASPAQLIPRRDEMQVYSAPLRDMQFVLNELHTDGFGDLSAFAEITRACRSGPDRSGEIV